MLCYDVKVVLGCYDSLNESMPKRSDREVQAVRMRKRHNGWIDQRTKEKKSLSRVTVFGVQVGSYYERRGSFFGWFLETQNRKTHTKGFGRN